MEKHYQPIIHFALQSLVTNVDEIVEAVKKVTATKAADNLDQVRTVVKKVAKANKDPLDKAMRSLYGDAGMSGAHSAAGSVGSIAMTSDMSQLVSAIDWQSWRPGNPAAAEQVAGKRLAEVWANADFTVSGIADTTIARIGNVIAGGLSVGDTWQTISDGIDDMIGDPYRSDIIAITETNRAFAAATLDEYQSVGIETWIWVAYDDACDECLDLVGAHDMGDDYPPAHPNCKCDYQPQLPDTQEE